MEWIQCSMEGCFKGYTRQDDWKPVIQPWFCNKHRPGQLGKAEKYEIINLRKIARLQKENNALKYQLKKLLERK